MKTEMPTILPNHRTIWIGTAEVNHKPKGQTANESKRVRAALIETPTGRNEKIMLEWEGRWIASNTAEFSREYEGSDGELIEDTDPEIAKRIDAALLYDWSKKH